MAKRPIFIPIKSGDLFLKEVIVEFDWSPGFAVTQKQKSIRAMHESAKAVGFESLLEISTKSEKQLGQRMSAFNLKVRLNNGDEIPLESAFQGSKKFENGMQYEDLYLQDAKTCKRDERIRNSGKIIGFSLEGLDFPSEPKTSFYDWLYIKALAPHEDFLQRLNNFEGFTDIEFNPARSINCQARSCALYVSLSNRGILQEVAYSPSKFIDATINNSLLQPYSKGYSQGRLL